jgi:transcriptional regulator with XRE-family HTH domain
MCYICVKTRNMKERILKLLDNEKLSATKFADIIGVQRSSISHIISGRNKPSFDFISKTIEKFPDVNAEWLITGKGNMYKDYISDSEEKGRDPELFTKKDIKEGSVKDEKDEKAQLIKQVTNVNNIQKVIILMEDGTFREYSKTE